MKNTEENREKIASAFLAILTGWFADDNVTTVTKELVLNANAFFDANMAMDKAFTDCGISVLNDDGQIDDDTGKLWDAAWSLAVEKTFQQIQKYEKGSTVMTFY